MWREPRFAVGAVGAFDGAVGRCGLHLAEGRKPVDDLLDAVLVAEADYIPQMEPGLACALLVEGVNRENAFQLAFAEHVEDFVHGVDSAACGGSPASGLGQAAFVEHVAHRGIELHDDLSGHLRGLRCGFGAGGNGGFCEVFG